MTPHPLTNFEIQACYENEPRFIRVYSRDNLPDKIKDGAYVVTLDEYSDIETHWIPLYGGIQKVRSSLKGGGGSSKSEPKRTKGEGGSNLFVCSFYKKITAK